MKLVTGWLSGASKPRVRNIFAVQTGTFVGEMFIFVKNIDNNLCFLSIPKNINVILSKEKFEFGINNIIIEYVEDIPRNIFKIIKRQFEYNEKFNNRWEQPHT